MTYINLWIWAYGPDIAETPPGPPKNRGNFGKNREKIGKKRGKKKELFLGFLEIAQLS